MDVASRRSDRMPVHRKFVTGYGVQRQRLESPGMSKLWRNTRHPSKLLLLWLLYMFAPCHLVTSKDLTCEELGGSGSLQTACIVSHIIEFTEAGMKIEGPGNLTLANSASISCPVPNADLTVCLGGTLHLGFGASILAGVVVIEAENVHMEEGSVISANALSKEQPSQTSGTPTGTDGAGGGYGGRGASCAALAGGDPSDVWGGDSYGWSSLGEPWKFGSPGGALGSEGKGGLGGGMVNVTAKNALRLNGTISADGGSGGLLGGGGSGGSLLVAAKEIHTYNFSKGLVSAVGGDGHGGGGGGRIALYYEIADGPFNRTAIGGASVGCVKNAGAAGTVYDGNARTLTINNGNQSSVTATQVLETPYNPVWNSFIMAGRSRGVSPIQNLRLKVHVAHFLREGSVFVYGTRSLGLGDLVLETNTNDGRLELHDSTFKVYGRLQMLVPFVRLVRSSMEVFHWRPEEGLQQGGGEINSNHLVLTNSSLTCTGLLKLTNQNELSVGAGSLLGADKVLLQNVLRVNVAEGGRMMAPQHIPYTPQMKKQLYCDSSQCPASVIPSSEDCNDNSPFSLHICRAEEVYIGGLVIGSIVHVNVRGTLWVAPGGLLSASGLGCEAGEGVGAGQDAPFPGAASGGAGHGGSGGAGLFNGTPTAGGVPYGSSELPCELGSGSGRVVRSSGSREGSRGGGVLVIGSGDQPIRSVQLEGAITADGGDHPVALPLYGQDRSTVVGGSGGGSGGSILIYMEYLTMTRSAFISSSGAGGLPLGGGGGGGGRVHFEWANVAEGEKYVARANVSGRIEDVVLTRGGKAGAAEAGAGTSGTLTTIPCPPGLYGLLCEECPVGTYKDEYGSSASLCRVCPRDQLPSHAIFISKRGGIPKAPCPYVCVSNKYSLPHCNTPIEDLIEDLGGPWLFTAASLLVLVLLALTISMARTKLVGNEDLSAPPPRTPDANNQVDHSFPFLESLNEVMESARVEESAGHVHRLFFQGSNSFADPFHLPHTPPEAILDLVYEDAYNRFVEEMNSLAAYQWWEACLYFLVALLAYPFAWSWQQWRRRCKIQRLREYVRSEYDHSCLKSCRSRALYEGLKVAATPDLLLGYIDVFLGGDEKRPDLPPPLIDRLPMPILFGGDGSYTAPFNLHSDNLLTSLVGQAVPATVWYRMVAGLNAQLRTVRRGALEAGLAPVVKWLETHARQWLSVHSVRVQLAQIEPSPSGHRKLGLLLMSAESDLRPSLTSAVAEGIAALRMQAPTQPRLNSSPTSPSSRYDSLASLSTATPPPPRLQAQLFHFSPAAATSPRVPPGPLSRPSSSIPLPPPQPQWAYSPSFAHRSLGPLEEHQQPLLAAMAAGRRRGWRIIDEASLASVEDQKDMWWLFSLLLRNTRPVGHDAAVGLAMSLLLLADMCLSFLTLLQFYSISLAGFWVVLLVLPLTPLFSFAAGLNALFSHGPRRAAGLGRVYGLWNVTSLSNALVALLWGFVHHQSWISILKAADSEPSLWWIFPSLQLAVKIVQARVVDRHVANLDIQDRTLYAESPATFWQS